MLKTKILLADRQMLFRKSVKVLLNANPSMEVIAEADNGRTLLDILKSVQVDIVVMDSDMPVLDCRSVIKAIAARYPAVKVVVLSVNYRDELVPDFIMNGANSYLSKNCEVETFYRAINTVMTEGCYIENITYKVMLGSLIKDPAGVSVPVVPDFNDKEINIMREICEGKTNREIATQLNISPSTVDFYKGKIYSKSKCNNVTGLLKFALRRGIVSL